jgi:riboflavin biosynthesis pyrimidine reductase
MNTLTPLETLYDAGEGSPLPLPPDLHALYGALRFPTSGERAYVIANFVTTLDGVVALEQGGGGPISGFNPHDRAVMGILRAVADAVIIGAGTLRPDSNHLWTAEAIYPPLADAYRQLRRRLGKKEPPLTVIVTASGDLDPGFRVFRSGETPVLVVTTRRGEQRLHDLRMPAAVQVVGVQDEGSIGVRAILEVVEQHAPGRLLLVEGGPQLMGAFFGEACLDELFLTLAPQVAGRDDATQRPGLVAGRRFAPENGCWGKLVGVKRAGSHLFLRYGWTDEGLAG